MPYDYYKPTIESPYLDENPYQNTKSHTQTYTSEKSENSVIITSYPSDKSYKDARVFVDGVEIQVSLPGKKKSEKERILSAVKEIGCLISKNPNLEDLVELEEKAKTIFKKYGLKTDDKSMQAMEAKYANDIDFMSRVEKSIKSCG